MDELGVRPPPRLLGWRLVLVCAMIGLVFSALSVAISHAMAVRQWPATAARDSQSGFVDVPGEGIYFLAAEQHPGVRAWGVKRTGPYWIHASDSGFFYLNERFPINDIRPEYSKPRDGKWPDSYIAVAAGWPCLCALGARRYIPGLDPMAVQFGFADSMIKGSPDVLPLVPMWRGLTLNTLFYGLPPLVLIVLTRWHKRRSRIHRNLCVRCKYDLAGLESLSPECGTHQPLPAKRPP